MKEVPVSVLLSRDLRRTRTYLDSVTTRSHEPPFRTSGPDRLCLETRLPRRERLGTLPVSDPLQTGTGP